MLPETTIRHLLRHANQEHRLAVQQAKEARRLLPDLTRILVEHYGVKRVVLFGSLARGTFRPGSDIDLMVSGMSTEHYFRAVGHLLQESPIPCDLVTLENASESIRRRISEEGIVLYDRERDRGDTA